LRGYAVKEFPETLCGFVALLSNFDALDKICEKANEFAKIKAIQA
jgi:hypothetical protein